jgi:hypothetical protein
MPTEEKRKRGRPPKLIDDDKTLQLIEGLARIQCTQKEAASVLKVDQNTFGIFLDTHKRMREAWDNARAAGLASLRRSQFKMAESNATMAIWLGKQYLEQRDHRDLTVVTKTHEEWIGELD